MGDPMVSVSGTWVMDLMVFFAFFFTQNLLLKILVPNICVSMETCSIGNTRSMFLNFSRTECS